MLDPDLLSTLIAAIYDAALDPAGWPAVLLALSDLLGGGHAGLLALDGPAGASLASVRLDPAAAALYEARYARLDFVAPAIAALTPGAVLLDHEVMPREAQARTAFCNEWTHPSDIGGCTGTVLRRAGPRATMLLVTHRRAVEEFAPDRLKAFRLLLPHLGRAAEAAARLSRGTL
jgi:hypothetical protein